MHPQTSCTPETLETRAARFDLYFDLANAGGKQSDVQREQHVDLTAPPSGEQEIVDRLVEGVSEV